MFLFTQKEFGFKEFKKINWLFINEHFEQYIISSTFIFFNNKSPTHMNGVIKKGTHPNTLIRASSTQYLEQATRFFENNRSNPTGMDIFRNFDYSQGLIWAVLAVVG